MTKLLEWLTAAVILGSIWLALVTKTVHNEFTREHSTLILLSPVIAVGIFGLGSLMLVLYRVFTFNNCEDAAMELKEEIKIAKMDLRKLGFNFDKQRS